MKNLMVVLLWMMVIVGCEQTTTSHISDGGTSGKVVFTFDKSNTPTSVKSLTTILSRSGYISLERTLDIVNDTSAVILFEEVAIGIWKVKVDAKNDQGQVVFTGESEVTVEEGEIVGVNLILDPVSTGVGGVSISVSWGAGRKPIFPKNYGGVNREAAMCVIQTTDGGYAIGGSGVAQSGDVDGWMVKTNSSGDIIWTKYFGGSSEDRINDIVQTSDGGFLFVGYKTGNDEDSWVVKIDSSGAVVWEKTFGGYGLDAFLKIKKGFDNTYWLCGYYYNSNFYEGRVAVIHSDGSMAWSKTYGGEGGDFAMNILPFQSGGALVVGNNGSIAGKSYDFWAFRINSEGGLVWEKTYGGSNDDRVAGICSTADGKIILTGYTTSYGNGTQDAWVVSINDLGVMLWSKTIGGFGIDYLLSVERSIDNNYIATGISTSYGYGQQGWAIKINSSGALVWSKTYGGPGTEGISDHSQTQDGGFVFAGSTKGVSNVNEDFWLGKTNADGVLE